MPYCEENDIIATGLTLNELIQATDDNKTGEVDSAKVTAAISKADVEIDGYCGDRYTVPFSTVPDEVKFLSVDIASYFIARRRQKVSNSIFDRYTKALAKLVRISEGKYSLKEATAKSDTSIGSTIDSTVKQTFTRTKNDSDGNVVGDKGSMETW